LAAKFVLSGLFGISLTLFAEGQSGNVLSGYENITALGALIVALLFLVTRYLPTAHEKAMKSLEVQSASFATAVEKMTTAHSADMSRGWDAIESQAKEIASMREHCAAINAKRGTWEPK
jgi:hypothetical protein